MIEVVLQVRDGRIVRVSSRGHAAGAPAGENILCAAVSVLIRSFARAVEENPGIESAGDAPDPGILDLTIRRIDETTGAWFDGISSFLLKGLEDLAAEYPEDLRVFKEIIERQ